MILERTICKESTHEKECPTIQIHPMFSCVYSRLMCGARLQHSAAVGLNQLSSCRHPTAAPVSAHLLGVYL